ncbi:hypothetical protein CKY47_29010 [Saccharothrix yanglingensis]|uniref:Uncharacterized protein n=1 Tax=Saccharothrix yanglingensis TaxID=659496 RepID=A0ABU0X7J7_9PSEU|nr:hypothetical protein [Saccharothrix yanglingensis]
MRLHDTERSGPADQSTAQPGPVAAAQKEVLDEAGRAVLVPDDYRAGGTEALGVDQVADAAFPIECPRDGGHRVFLTGATP